jgi:hypothetical protein
MKFQISNLKSQISNLKSQITILDVIVLIIKYKLSEIEFFRKLAWKFSGGQSFESSNAAMAISVALLAEIALMISE